jgi:hypothetical protein
VYLSPECVSIDEDIKLIFENHTDSETELGFYLNFDLEFLDGTNYIKVQDDDYTDISIAPGETAEKQLNLYSLISQHNNGKIKKGFYRLIKKVHSLNGIYVLCADFEICEEGRQNNVSESRIKQYQTKEGRLDINEHEFVSMYLSPEICSNNNTPIKWIIKNNSQKSISFGMKYLLEYFDNGIWISLNSNTAFPDVGLGLFAGKTLEQYLCNFSPINNSNRTGKYRITKRFTLNVDNSIMSAKGTHFNLCIEYEIK